MSPPAQQDTADPQTQRPKVQWLVLLSVIFVPTLLTVLAAQANFKDLAPAIAVIGGGLSGIVAGILLGRRFGRTPGVQVLLALIFTGVFAVACVTMNCVGCIAGGYKLDFR